MVDYIDWRYIPELRKKLKEGKWREYLNGLNTGMKRPRTKKEFSIIKQITRTIDMSILGYLSNNPETDMDSILHHIQPPFLITLRLEVMNHYNLVNFNENTGEVTIGEDFGRVDVTSLPIHADQIPLCPREKLAYILIKSGEVTGGLRTLREIHELSKLHGDEASFSAVYFGVRGLKNLGIVERSDKKFGYTAWYTVEDMFVYESVDELLNLCRSIDVGLAARRGMKL